MRKKFERLADLDAKHNEIHRLCFETPYGHFVDRGDPTTYDYKETGSKTVLNTDGNWHDLDLSSIIPKEALAVLLFAQVKDDAVGSYFELRKNGNSNIYNAALFYTEVANVFKARDFIVACDTDGIVEYRGTNTAFTQLDLTVKGWWV